MGPPTSPGDSSGQAGAERGGGRYGEGAVCREGPRLLSGVEQSRARTVHPPCPAQGRVCGVRMRPPDVSSEDGGAPGCPPYPLGEDPRV